MRPRPSSLNTSTNPNSINTFVEDSAESPRSQVSTRFEKLLINEDEQQQPHCQVDRLTLLREKPELENEKNTMEKTRKRTKFSVREGEVPETPQAGTRMPDMVDYGLAAPGCRLDLKATSDNRIGDSSIFDQRVVDNKPRKKRVGTPPLLGNASNTDTEELLGDVYESDRASLTWHDNEITGFDPNDQDDDGRGLDGIGFKPTAARNDARALKKRQQLAEYRSRVSSEARAKRSEKRRGLSAATVNFGESVQKDTRVKFAPMEVETIFI